MIRHMVLFTLKDDIEDSDKEYILGQAAKLADVDTVLKFEIGALLDPTNADYKSRIWSDFENALLIDFEDEAGLIAYQVDPFHVVFAKEIRERVSALKVVDFVTP
jgi:hypothetical protein